METILATAFGRIIDVQRGESDELTKAANERFRQMDEGRLTSRDVLVMMISELLKYLPPSLPNLSPYDFLICIASYLRSSFS